MTAPRMTLPAWQALRARAAAGMPDIAAALATEAGRTDRLMMTLDGALFDLSKNAVDAPTLDLLLQLARDTGVEQVLADMMAGKPVNTVENRPAWHTALRAPDAPDDVRAVKARMKTIADTVRGDKTVDHVIHIGIGGSDLGPRLVCDALRGLHDGPQMHFVANIDPDALDPLVASLDPARVAITVASKSWTTQETATNFKAVRMWLNGRTRHVYAMTANPQAAQADGIAPDNILPLWEWVGGRFSLWSAVGLPIALAFGYDVFEEMLAGANAADRHTATAPLEKNIPVLLGLLDVWYRSFLGLGARAVIPYAERLAQLPAYAQQLVMESTGKRVDRQGRILDYATAPVVFGAAGTSAQHSFFQMLHQGSDVVPVDLIAARESAGCPARHRALLANLLAQGRALMLGRGGTPEKACPGNRPSTTVLLPAIDARSLGLLLAVWEHRVAVAAQVWNINAFDQFGVELGKDMAKQLLAWSDELAQNESLDISTSKLIFHTFPAQ